MPWVAFASGYPTPLLQNQPQERPLAPGEIHEYSLAVPEPSFVYLMVEQKGIDLAFSIDAPDGHLLEKVDGPGGSRAYEVLALILDEEGEYLVRLEGPEEGEAGAYKLWIDVLRPRRPDDEIRVQAEGIFTEGLHFEAQGTGKSRRAAIEKFRETIPYWQRLGDEWAEAFSRQKVGYQLRVLGEMAEAREAFEAAIPIWESSGDRGELANTFNNLGITEQALGDPDAAQMSFQRAREYAVKTSDKRREADALNNLGWLASEQLRFDEGRALIEAALATLGENGEGSARANYLSNLGAVLRKLGESSRSLEVYSEAISILEKLENRRQLAYTEGNLAVGLWKLGRLGEALAAFEKAIAYHRQVGNRAGEASAMENLATFYLDLRLPERAALVYEDVLSAYRVLEDPFGESRTLVDLGFAEVRKGNAEGGLLHFESALRIAGRLSDSGTIATAEDGISLALKRLSKLEQAVRHSRAAVAIRLQTGRFSEANISRIRLAGLLDELGQYEEAVELAAGVLEDATARGERQLRILALESLARIEKAQGDLSKASVLCA